MRTILSGMRPTGKLHLGNFEGALSEWIRLQNEKNTKCFFMVADWHALTTEYEESASIEENIEEMVLDWLSAGLDPEKSVIFRQSYVREHAELSLLLSMITPISWLERNPTYKEQLTELKEKEISTHGFLGYPVLQAADILLYGATHVPVGEDQLPHLELTREIARRFNYLYKKKVFIEPQAILSQSPKLLGIDGKKMSKSYRNTVEVSESENSLKKKINEMFTDPNKIRASDPGHPRPCAENPTGCVVFSLHEIYPLESRAAPQPSREFQRVNEILPRPLAVREKQCKEGSLGCVQCKQELFEELKLKLAPVREKREMLCKKKGVVTKILLEGSKKAERVARKTLEAALIAMGFTHRRN